MSVRAGNAGGLRSLACASLITAVIFLACDDDPTRPRTDGGEGDPVNNVFIFRAGYETGQHTWAYRFRREP